MASLERLQSDPFFHAQPMRPDPWAGCRPSGWCRALTSPLLRPFTDCFAAWVKESAKGLSRSAGDAAGAGRDA